MGTLNVGDRLADRFELRREIARGGMGVVFEAEQVHTHRSVAVKFAPKGAEAGSQLAERLLREARVLGKLRHQNVVELFDAGICPVVGPYLAMEMLDGRPLDGILAARHKVGLKELLFVARSVAEALLCAQRRGVLHRDIKPGNIFIARTTMGTEIVKLIDFGIARTTDEELVSSAKLTKAGDILGTLDYIAPEQLVSVENANEKSDQYSLAVVMYECLTGELPSLASRMASAPKSIPVDLPRDLVEAMLKALNPDPAQRFPNMEKFLAALAGVKVQGAPESLLMKIEEATAVIREAATQVEGVRREEAVALDRRRKHRRAPYVTPCRILRLDGSHVDGRSEDISEGGMLVVTSQAAAAPVGTDGEDVVVRFALPTDGSVVAQRAKIRWIRDSRGRCAVGVEFQRAEAIMAASISTYVRVMAGEA